MVLFDSETTGAINSEHKGRKTYNKSMAKILVHEDLLSSERRAWISHVFLSLLLIMNVNYES